MLFQPRREALPKPPEGYIFTIPPRSTVPRSPQPTGIFLRARRSAPENESLPYIILLLGGSWVGVFAYSSEEFLPWTLALALGLCTLLLYIRFAYAVQGELHLRPRRLPSTFLRVVLPSFPAVVISAILMVVGSEVFLYASYPWSPVHLFMALLGVSLALFIGKNIQWVLDGLVNRRVSRRPSNSPLAPGQRRA